MTLHRLPPYSSLWALQRCNSHSVSITSVCPPNAVPQYSPVGEGVGTAHTAYRSVTKVVMANATRQARREAGAEAVRRRLHYPCAYEQPPPQKQGRMTGGYTRRKPSRVQT
jgi:hypothetical protein